MSSRMKALININPSASAGNIVHDIERSITAYMRDHAKGEGSFEVSGGAMRKKGYEFPRTFIQGTPNDAGYALFTHFTIVDDGDTLSRTLQTSINLPVTELHSSVSEFASDNAITVSIGEWGDAKTILQLIGDHMSVGDYYLISTDDTVERVEKLEDDPLSMRTDVSSASASITH